jgi:sulfite reductase (ferredoxin)
MSVAHDEKLSAVEQIKTDSNFLRGSIAEELADGTPAFSETSVQLLKTHGTYLQDDRDLRAQAKKDKVPGGKYFSMMVRTAIPGGKITSDQMLAELDLCDEVGNTTLRITTRQGLQLHGVLKSNVRQVIHRINEVQLTTLAACGDVNRNVMCSPVPYKNDPVYDDMQSLTDQLARHFLPRTRAYHEIWLTDSETGEKTLAAGGQGEVIEPIYGTTYLPRKFKMGVALPGDNSADIYAYDLGFFAICENFKIVGYNVLVGGGMGVTPSADKTFVALAQPLAFVTADQAIPFATAIVKVQRDFGNRADRKVARMKYLIANWGLDRFRQKVEEYYGHAVDDPREAPVTGHHDGMGWHPQGDGKFFYGLNVENGRILDSADMQLKSALREICTTLAPPMRLTPHQGIIFCDLTEGDRDTLFAILRKHGVKTTEEISSVRRWSMACPALPTCGLAITESERFLPSVIDQLERELEALGLADQVFTTRMTGCPNGCARPYNADIGLVGKAKNKYTIFLGGHREGDRLNWIYQDMVPADEVVSVLRPVLVRFASEKLPDESLGDFCNRLGRDALAAG